MLHLLKKLFKPEKVSSANNANVLVFAELYINPNSDVKVNFTYSDALPDNLIARSLFMLVLYQAANIRVNLITEHSSTQAAYQQIMVDIVSQWPEGGIAETGEFFTSLSFFKIMIS